MKKFSGKCEMALNSSQKLVLYGRVLMYLFLMHVKILKSCMTSMKGILHNYKKYYKIQDLRNRKHFSVLIYSCINTRGNSTQFRVFPISMTVDITVYQHRKMFYYFFII